MAESGFTLSLSVVEKLELGRALVVYTRVLERNVKLESDADVRAIRGRQLDVVRSLRSKL